MSHLRRVKGMSEHWSIWKVCSKINYFVHSATHDLIVVIFLGIDYENKEYIITLGNDNMIYVETLMPGQKNQVSPLFPEPLASYFFYLKLHSHFLSLKNSN